MYLLFHCCSCIPIMPRLGQKVGGFFHFRNFGIAFLQVHCGRHFTFFLLDLKFLQPFLFPHGEARKNGTGFECGIVPHGCGLDVQPNDAIPRGRLIPPNELPTGISEIEGLETLPINEMAVLGEMGLVGSEFRCGDSLRMGIVESFRTKVHYEALDTQNTVRIGRRLVLLCTNLEGDVKGDFGD